MLEVQSCHNIKQHLRQVGFVRMIILSEIKGRRTDQREGLANSAPLSNKNSDTALACFFFAYGHCPADRVKAHRRSARLCSRCNTIKQHLIQFVQLSLLVHGRHFCPSQAQQNEVHCLCKRRCQCYHGSQCLRALLRVLFWSVTSVMLINCWKQAELCSYEGG